MWKILVKEDELGEPTSFLDHFYLGCTQTECQTSKDIVHKYRQYVSNPASVLGAFEEAALFRETWREYFLMVLWHGRSCKEIRGKILRSGEQNNSTVIQSRNAMHGRPSFLKTKKMVSVGELSKVCSQIVLNCLHLARICRFDFYGPWTHLFVRSRNGQKLVANVWRVWSLTWVISNNVVMWETAAHQCRSGLFQDSDIRWTLMHFRKSNICATQLDVQETDISLTQKLR